MFSKLIMATAMSMVGAPSVAGAAEGRLIRMTEPDETVAVMPIAVIIVIAAGAALALLRCGLRFPTRPNSFEA